MTAPELELDTDPVPAPHQELIGLFQTDLSETRFPDVDADTLSELAATVRSRAQDVARARQVLEEVIGALEEARAELDEKARRGLAYAQVFAEGQEELKQKLDGLSLARPKGKRGPAPGQKRKRKSAKQKPAPLLADEGAEPKDKEAAGRKKARADEAPSANEPAEASPPKAQAA